MNRRIFFGIVLMAVVLMIGIGIGSNRGTDPQVIPTAGGDTVIVTQSGSHFPFPLLIIPLVIVGFFAFGRRGSGGHWGPHRPDDNQAATASGSLPAAEADRAAEWRAWHEAQHANPVPPVAPGT